MKMNDEEIADRIDLWLSVKESIAQHVSAKVLYSTCENFLNSINENVCDLSEVGDEWLGFDDHIDKVIKSVYYSDADEDCEDRNNDDENED